MQYLTYQSHEQINMLGNSKLIYHKENVMQYLTPQSHEQINKITAGVWKSTFSRS